MRTPLPLSVQAVDSFRRASELMTSHLILVDNSADKAAVYNTILKQQAKEVIATERTLNFPELHNFMANLAFERELEFYFWAHADNYVLAAAPDRDMGIDALACLREHVTASPNWGMVLFAYDHLTAFRTQAVVQVPWDPRVFQYGSECDAYGRMRTAGYAARACKIHHSYDMKRVVDVTDTTPYAAVRRIIEADARLADTDGVGRNDWRENAMSAKEQAWRQRMKVRHGLGEGKASWYVSKVSDFYKHALSQTARSKKKITDGVHCVCVRDGGGGVRSSDESANAVAMAGFSPHAGTLAMSAMQEYSRSYLVEKWGSRTCQVRDLPCHKPWPFCPDCPSTLPECASKTPTRALLQRIHTTAQRIIASDADQPPQFES